MDRQVPHFREELEALQGRLLEMGGLAEERVRAAIHGLVQRDPAAHRQGPARRRADQPASHRGRQPLLPAAGAPSADGHRPARHRRGGEDQHRSRARRRPGGQHRRGQQALHRPPAGQEADRHPADGRHRPGDAARRAGRVRQARYASSRTRSSTRTTGSTA